MKINRALAFSRALVEGMLDLLFPPLCVGCNQLGFALCHACAQLVESTPLPICGRCGRPQRWQTQSCRSCYDWHPSEIRWVRAAGLHRWPVREAIHALKYRGQSQLAPSLARYLWAEFMRDEWQAVASTIDLVVPVPLHNTRLIERGYNQSQLLATYFCQHVDLPLSSDCLVRRRATQQQVGLHPNARRQNVAGAFWATDTVADKTLLLIDDVTTTGATLQACASAATQAGAKTIYGLALAMPGVDYAVNTETDNTYTMRPSEPSNNG